MVDNFTDSDFYIDVITCKERKKVNLDKARNSKTGHCHNFYSVSSWLSVEVFCLYWFVH